MSFRILLVNWTMNVCSDVNGLQFLWFFFFFFKFIYFVCFSFLTLVIWISNIKHQIFVTEEERKSDWSWGVAKLDSPNVRSKQSFRFNLHLKFQRVLDSTRSSIEFIAISNYDICDVYKLYACLRLFLFSFFVPPIFKY